MSKPSELDKVSKLYILDCIDSDGFDECDYFNQCDTIKNKIDFLRGRFKAEYQWRIGHIGEQRAMVEWLQGLAINIAFYNHDILSLAIKWGSLPENATEKQENKILTNYWMFMANKICQLLDGYHVPREI